MKILYCFPEATNPNHYAYSNIRATLSELGHTIVDFDFIASTQAMGKEGMVAHLRALIEKERPDIFLHGIVTDELPVGFLDELRDRKDITSIVFFSDDDWRLYNHSLLWVKHYNFATTNDINAMPIYREAAYNHVYNIQYAANPKIFYPRNVDKMYDVSFVGQAYLGRPELIYHLMNNGINVRVWGSGWEQIPELKSIAGPPLPTEEMIRTFCASRIVLGLAWCSVPDNNGNLMPQIKGRTFEYPACRAFQITYADERLKNYFDLEKELATFRDGQELVSKIKYYLTHEAERERMAEAAYKRVISEHTWKSRWDGFFSFLSEQNAFQEKESLCEVESPSPDEVKTMNAGITQKKGGKGPLVSVYCFVYNREKYIAKTIESVLNQTYMNIELIILNDGSTDGTETIIKHYLKDPRVKYHYQENIGRNLDKFHELNNLAIGFTSGDYICAIGADDVYSPQKIERQLKDFEQFTELDISFCNAQFINDKGELLQNQFRHHKAVQFNRFNLLRWLFTANFIPHPSVMIRRKSFYEQGCYETPFAADFHFWLKTAKTLNFKYIDEILWYYRIHDDSSTHKKNADICAKATFDVMKDIYEKYSIEDLYPEIGACSDRQKAIYSAHLDFGNEMINGNFYLLPLFALKEYSAALECEPNGIEALNNIAIASVIAGNADDAGRYFEMLSPYASSNRVVSQNIDVYKNSTLTNMRREDYRIFTDNDSELQQKIHLYANRPDIIPGSTLTQPVLQCQKTIEGFQHVPIHTKYTEEKKEGKAWLSVKPAIAGFTSIIIQLSGHNKHLKQCIESIEKHTIGPKEIIFISNGGKDENTKWLKKLSNEKGYAFFEAGKGSGVARCFNKGITAAKGEYIVLISSDGVVPEEWLPGMLECANSALEAGIVGPMTNNIDGPQRLLNIGHESLEQLDAFARFFREKNRHRRISSRKIDSFCILFRRDLTDKIGLLDEGFDSEKFAVDDYCLRAALEGYKNLIAGDVFIHNSQSFTGDKVSHEYAMAKNRKLFNDKWSNLDVNTPIGKKALVLKAMEKAREHYHKEEFDPAISTLLEWIAYVPNEKAIYQCIAEMLIAAKLFKEAENIINSMPEEFRKDARTLELSGYCKEGMGLYNEAEELANKVLSINPNSASALNLKGRLAFKKDDHDAAENLFRKAIENDPGLGEPYYSLGEMKWASGQKDEALSFIEKGFILSPAMPDMAILYYSSAIDAGNIEEAEQLFRDAKALYPLNKKIAFLLIDLLMRQGKSDAAMNEIEGALITFGIDDGILQAALEVRDKVGALRIEGTSKNSATISLCMIVKNEEKYLAKCLMSVKSVVDQMVVVDTGSSDRTKDIARAFGAEVYDFEWNDNFSDARNMSLSKAKADWIFILDADETISALDYRLFSETVNKRSSTPSAYIINTRNYIHSPNIDGWIANDGRYSSEEAGTGWNPTNKVRLFPNDSRIRFENPVHELVEPSLRKIGIEIIKSDIQVHHYGKLDIEKVESKGKKYFALGEKKLVNNESDAKSIFELAVQAGEIKEFQKAIELWQKLLKLDTPTAKGFHLIAYVNMGNAYIGLGELEKAFEASEKAIELNPNSESAVINYALSALWLGEAGKAIPVLENLMLTRPDYPPAIGLLSVAYMMEGKMKTGVEYLDKIKRMGYDGATYLLDHANKLISAGRVDSAISLLEDAIESKNSNNEILSLLSECRKN